MGDWSAPVCIFFMLLYGAGPLSDMYLKKVGPIDVQRSGQQPFPVSQDNSLPVSLKQDNNNIPKLSVEKHLVIMIFHEN